MLTSFISIERICDILLKNELISPAQKKSIISQEVIQKSKLKRINALKQSGPMSRDTNGQDITPVDIISSFKLKKTGTKEELTEEVIMRTIAYDLQLPFKKIDRL